MKLKRIAILTGGGDVPGLNPAIAAVVREAAHNHIEVLGIRRGWQGLSACDPSDSASVREHTQQLTPESVRHIAQQGGTVLRSSRTNPRKLKGADGKTFDGTAQVKKTLSALEVDALVAIGGEDTLGFAAHLAQQGVRVVGIPKTMDNDVWGTELCLGFATCVSRTVEYIHQLRTSTASHERILIVEVMGRNSGITSLYPAFLAQADRAVVAEVPFDAQVLGDKLMADRRQSPERYAIVTISEGARLVDGELSVSGAADAFGHRKLGGIGQQLAERLQAQHNVGTLVQNLGYLVRSGAPCAVDVTLGFAFGQLAVARLMAQGTCEMMTLENGVFGHTALSDVQQGQRKLDIARDYDAAEYRPRIASLKGRSLFWM